MPCIAPVTGLPGSLSAFSPILLTVTGTSALRCTSDLIFLAFLSLLNPPCGHWKLSARESLCRIVLGLFRAGTCRRSTRGGIPVPGGIPVVVGAWQFFVFCYHDCYIGRGKRVKNIVFSLHVPAICKTALHVLLAAADRQCSASANKQYRYTQGD